MLKSFLSTFTFGALILAIIGLGAYGLVRKSGYERDLVTERAHWTSLEQRLDECVRGREQEKTSHNQTERTAAETQANLEASRQGFEEMHAERADTDKALAAFKAMTDKLQRMIDNRRLAVVARHGRMILKVPAGILFPVGSADLSSDGQEVIHEVARVLLQFPDRRFMIAGHTDNAAIGPPSPFKSNLELSTTRALSVTQQLIKSGMSPAQLIATGYGEYEPEAPNTSEEARLENRRVEIVLLPNTTELPTPGQQDAGADAAAKPSKNP